MPSRAYLPAVLTAAIAVAGCSADQASPDRVRDAADEAIDTSKTAIDTGHGIVDKFCPKARSNGGQDLTPDEAKKCLDRAYDSYTDELKKRGYDPEALAGEK